MGNSTATPLQGGLLLDNQLELVTPTTVVGTLYGIAFTLFCLYAYSLAPRLRDDDTKRQARFMLAYSTIIMLCGLYYLVADAWVTQNAYIKHSNYPGGPAAYVLSSYATFPVIPVGLACELVIDALTSAIQIWRLWIIWSATPYTKLVAVLPVLCFLTFIGLELRTLIRDTTIPLAEHTQVDYKADTAQLSIQATTTIYCTVLISLYLVFQQWQQRKLIGKSQGSTGYMNIVAMLIESYALESIWVLTLVITSNQHAVVFFGESVVYIETIAYLLVQYRVACGKAYESQKGRRDISSLRWNHSNHATTQFGGTSGIQGSLHVPAIPEASNAHEASSMA